MQEPAEEARTGDGGTAAERVEAVSAALAAKDVAFVRGLAGGLRAPDLADLIELLAPGERIALVLSLIHI